MLSAGHLFSVCCIMGIPPVISILDLVNIRDIRKRRIQGDGRGDGISVDSAEGLTRLN